MHPEYLCATRKTKVIGIVPIGKGFRVYDDRVGKVTAKRVIMATGNKDVLADLRNKKNTKTYNRRDSLVVTHPTTNLPACGLSTAERTGSPVLHTLWSYVLGFQV